jgi:UPF0042 nucleotide-binding protein
VSPRARQAAQPEDASRFVVLTGLSGAGKSQALNALEDLGFFCVDNLPITLMPALAELALRAGSDITKVAVIVDVREGAMLRQFPAVYRRLRRAEGLNPVLIFLDAREKALVRRYSETRRPHPLAPASSAIEGIRAERQQLAPIRKMADQIVDTTDMTVHELRQAFLAISRGGTRARGPVVTIQSFGFKHGLPVDADLVFDVRFLPNPHFVPALRAKTGRDRDVVRFLERAPETHEFLARVSALLAFLLPQYAKEGKSYVTIAVGCTGGRHRSVALAEAIKRQLGAVEGIRLRVRHRDIASD